MNFQAALTYCKHGHDIRMPEWGGFWRWNAEAKTIHMHCRDGRIIDFRNSEDLDYTLAFLFRDDWELVRNPGHTEHDQLAGKREYSVPPGGLMGQPLPAPAVDVGQTPCAVCGTPHSFWLPCPVMA